MIVKDCLKSGKKTLFRDIRTGEYLEPSSQQLNEYLGKWTPGSIDKGPFIVVDIDELPDQDEN